MGLHFLSPTLMLDIPISFNNPVMRRDRACGRSTTFMGSRIHVPPATLPTVRAVCARAIWLRLNIQLAAKLGSLSSLGPSSLSSTATNMRVRLRLGGRTSITSGRRFVININFPRAIPPLGPGSSRDGSHVGTPMASF